MPYNLGYVVGCHFHRFLFLPLSGLSTMRVAVIGAGPAGMTAALQLSRGGAEVSVYEAGACVGGLARSLDLWGQRVDLGPHRFFSTDARVNRFWLDVVGSDYAMVDRLTRIYYKDRFFHYPLKPWNAYWNMGISDAASCLASYVKEQLRPGNPTTRRCVLRILDGAKIRSAAV